MKPIEATSPLHPSVSIVDERGRPTPVFLRQWEAVRTLLGAVDHLTKRVAELEGRVSDLEGGA